VSNLRDDVVAVPLVFAAVFASVFASVFPAVFPAVFPVVLGTLLVAVLSLPYVTVLLLKEFPFE